MATSQNTIDFLMDQAAGAGELHARKMFGEYALYLEGKVVALVCDDRLFVKKTDAGRAFAGDAYKEGLPYPGAKPYFAVDESLLDDREWLAGLLRETADALPVPAPKKKRR